MFSDKWMVRWLVANAALESILAVIAIALTDNALMCVAALIASIYAVMLTSASYPLLCTGRRLLLSAKKISDAEDRSLSLLWGRFLYAFGPMTFAIGVAIIVHIATTML